MENPDILIKPMSGGRGIMCRLCMKNHGDALNIFVSKATSGMALWNVVQDLLQVQVAEGDGLPETVCCHCLRKLMEFSEFKEMCLKSVTEFEMRKINAEDSNLKVKEEPMSDEFLEEGETYGEENLGHDESQDMQVACDPLDVEQGIVEEEAALDESAPEVENYREEDLSDDNFEERQGYNVVCLPIAMGSQYEVEEEAYSREMLVGKQNASDDEYGVRSKDPLGVEDCADNTTATRMIPNMNKKMSNMRRTRIQNGKPIDFVIIETVASTQGQSFVSGDNATCSKRLNDERKTKRRNEESFKPLENHVIDRSECICNCCGFKCSDENQLAVHTVGHILEASKAVMKMPHKARESVTGSGIHKCETCGKAFKYKNDFLRHFIMHTDMKPFKCETCGKRFYRKSKLAAHSALHE